MGWPSLDIADANNNPLRTAGNITISLRLGTGLLSIDFTFCNSMAAPVILGCNFCECVFEGISPRKRMVRLDDGYSIPYSWKLLRSASRKHVSLPEAQKSPTNSPFSTKMHISKPVQALPETQVLVEVTTRQHAANVAKPSPSIYQQRRLAFANGVVSVQLD